MRIAVRHNNEDHSNHGWFAYALGRIDDFVHPLTGETTQKNDVVGALLERAKNEYPESDGYEHRVERLVDNGDNTSSWVPVDEESDKPALPSGEAHDVSLGSETQINPVTQPQV